MLDLVANCSCNLVYEKFASLHPFMNSKFVQKKFQVVRTEFRIILAVGTQIQNLGLCFMGQYRGFVYKNAQLMIVFSDFRMTGERQNSRFTFT